MSLQKITLMQRPNSEDETELFKEIVIAVRKSLPHHTLITAEDVPNRLMQLVYGGNLYTLVLGDY